MSSTHLIAPYAVADLKVSSYGSISSKCPWRLGSAGRNRAPAYGGTRPVFEYGRLLRASTTYMRACAGPIPTVPGGESAWRVTARGKPGRQFGGGQTGKPRPVLPGGVS